MHFWIGISSSSSTIFSKPYQFPTVCYPKNRSLTSDYRSDDLILDKMLKYNRYNIFSISKFLCTEHVVLNRLELSTRSYFLNIVKYPLNSIDLLIFRPNSCRVDHIIASILWPWLYPPSKLWIAAWYSQFLLPNY